MWDPGLSRARCIRQTETNLTHALISSLHCAPYSSIVTKKIAVKIPGDGLLTLIGYLVAVDTSNGVSLLLLLFLKFCFPSFSFLLLPLLLLLLHRPLLRTKKRETVENEAVDFALTTLVRILRVNVSVWKSLTRLRLCSPDKEKEEKH